MRSHPIGVILEAFNKPFPEAMALARKIGARGIQIYGTPAALRDNALNTPEARKAFLARARDNGLTVSALCADFGHGFGDARRNAELVEASKRVIDAALEFGTNIVTTHIGVVPDDPRHERYRVMQDACGALAAYASSRNAHFAVETGPETSATLKAFLDSLDSTGVAVNLDPANLVMVSGDDPVQAVYTLGKYIVHTHVKDGRRLKPCDPEVVYGLKPGAAGDAEPAFLETPLGDGEVPFQRYLAALNDIGYAGFLTIERETGDTPAADIEKAYRMLKGLMEARESNDERI